jgi:hypothetical protein
MRNDDHVIAESSASNQEEPVWVLEDPFAKSPRARFTIGRIMIAIAVMAGLLSLPAPFSLTVVAFSMPCAAVGIAQRLVHRRHLRLAAYCFWGVAISINLLTALLCIVPSSSLHFAIFLGLIAVGIPTILALGVAWALLYSRQKWLSPRSRDAAGFAVFLLAVLPIATLSTCWPLNLLALLAARPTMEPAVDQVEDQAQISRITSATQPACSALRLRPCRVAALTSWSSK